MTAEKQADPFKTELYKFLRKKAVVKYKSYDDTGKNKLESVEGLLVGLSPHHLSVVLRTAKEKILIKHIVSITRPRENPETQRKDVMAKLKGGDGSNVQPVIIIQKDNNT